MESAEKNEISVHESRVFIALLKNGGWMSSNDVASMANVASRTARQHLLKLTRLGLLDQAEVFPGHRYRLSRLAKQRNHSYYGRLVQACEILGLSPTEIGDIDEPIRMD